MPRTMRADPLPIPDPPSGRRRRPGARGDEGTVEELGWASEAFARVGVPMFAVDLPVRDWLLAPHVLHSCGWLVSELERQGTPDALGRLFDVAIYVDHTTSARQRPRRP
jgi:hypothetical protein